MKRHGYIIGGQVQGVGFRPFVYRAATRLRLTGHVGNTSDGVRVEVQGTDEALAAFAHALEHDLPPLARITSLRREELPLADGEAAFAIAHSEGHHGHAVLVSPDVATCDNCLADMRDPANRRYRYPFTNCTDCGPRYTITHSGFFDGSLHMQTPGAQNCRKTADYFPFQVLYFVHNRRFSHRYNARDHKGLL